MGETPEELRANIERQRAAIASDVDAIGDRVSPAQIADRKKAEYRYRAGRQWGSLRNRIVGDPTIDDDYYASLRSPRAGSSLSSEDSRDGVVARAAGTAGHVPEHVVAQTRGAPLAAGLLALGAGLLIGALLPESQAERRAVAHVQPDLEVAANHLSAIGQDSADHLQAPVTDAVDTLKSSAQDSVQDLRQQATEAVSTVADQAKP